MNYLPTNLNTIIGLVIVVVILILYYTYYFIQNMIQSEIKDFYIKTEKRRLRKEKIDRDREMILQHQNMELQNKLQEKKLEENFLNFENFDNDNEDEINNIEIESFIDPIKNKKSSNNGNGEIDQNQILSDRIFNT
jgi:uncharacterized protein YxeA